jgi:predicted PurR-regulated permease PerM
VLGLIYSIHTVLMPFIYALVFVYILRPGVDLLEKKGLPRTLSLILSYLGLLLVLILLSMYVGPILFKESNGFIKRFPEYLTVVNGYLNDFIKQHPYLQGDQATNFLNGFSKSFQTFLQKAALSVPSVTATFFGSLANFVLAPIIAFYILKDTNRIKQTLRDMIPAPYRIEGMHIVKKIDLIVGGFLKGQALVALSVGVLSGITLSVLGVDYAILLGFLIGLFNIIPYLGPVIGGALAVIIALGTSWKLALIVIAALVIVQQVDSILISPRIMSQQVNLHPALVIFALLAGGSILGFIGMLIAIPIAAVCKALYLHFRERESESRPGGPDIQELQPTIER